MLVCIIELRKKPHFAQNWYKEETLIHHDVFVERSRYGRQDFTCAVSVISMTIATHCGGGGGCVETDGHKMRGWDQMPMGSSTEQSAKGTKLILLLSL